MYHLGDTQILSSVIQPDTPPVASAV